MGKPIKVSDDFFITTRAAARMLGVSERTLCDWASKGFIPVVKLSARTLRFRMSTVRRFIAERESPARVPSVSVATESERLALEGFLSVLRAHFPNPPKAPKRAKAKA